MLVAGAGSVLSVLQGPIAFGRPPPESDSQAMARDWAAIGGDFRAAMDSYGKQENKKQARRSSAADR